MKHPPAEEERVDFDQFALSYQNILGDAVAMSGESADFFVDLKIEIMTRLIKRCRKTHPLRFLDYGCGTGRAFDFIIRRFEDADYVGVDPSAESIEQAKKRNRSKQAVFGLLDDLRKSPDAHFSHAFSAVVFHHIPVAERRYAVARIYRALAPGGIFFLFEHNPLNPLTRRVVDQCPFDEDAVLLPASESRRLLQQAGFESIRILYYFFFPRSLSWLRPLERALSWNRFGAQYVAIGLKPYPM